MDIVIDIFNYIFTVIMIGVFLTWLSLTHSMYKSFTKTPYLDKFENTSKELPKVSIILPARNEEKFIGKCLESFVQQDYTNYEIIAVDDSSSDKTWDIIEKYDESVSELDKLDIIKSESMTQRFISKARGIAKGVKVGGISNANDAWEKIINGACLIQFYSAFVFEGAGTTKSIVKGLKKKLREHSLDSLDQAVGMAVNVR